MTKVMGRNRAILFTLGEICFTRGVCELVDGHGLDPMQYLLRHAHGMWGDLEDGDKAQNEEAVKNGGRIFSAYNLAEMPESRLWVITEADRSVTTLLLPNEY
jgi:hypothetical protein